MPRAAKLCATPDCPNPQPCPTHTPAPWSTSNRRHRTTSGSHQQKRARRILSHHDAICHVCGQYGADQVDHITPLAEGGPDNDSNLRPIHSEPCHTEKTQREAQRARRRRTEDIGELDEAGGR